MSDLLAGRVPNFFRICKTDYFHISFKYLAVDVLDRDRDEYAKQHYYRAHWQPYCAYFGLFGCTMMVIFSGWPAIYLLNVGDSLSTAADLKSSGLLVADVIGAYSGVRHQILPKIRD